MVGIYKITSPSGKVYIGQSITLEKRQKQYSSMDNCKGQTKLYNSLLKYGFSEHIFEIIEECEMPLLNTRERYWQDFYNVLGKSGLNCRLQSTEDRSGYVSNETKAAMREARIGKKQSEETKQKIGERNRGREVSETVRKQISESLSGRVRSPFTEEHRQNLSKARKGVPLTQAQKDAHKGPRGPQKNPREKGYTLSEEHKANLKGPRGPQKNPKRNKTKVVK
jgi:group I intron endonuclease